MNIAICDDDQVFIDIIKTKIINLLQLNNLSFKIYEFTSADELLSSHNKNNFDVIFLDMEMPEKSGIEIANTLRSIFDNVIIIFVTSHNDLVFESIRYQPFRFIRKGSLDNELPEAIIMLCKKIINGKLIYTFKFKGDLISLKISDILYFESHRNIVEIYTNNDCFTCNDSISNKEKEFSCHGFIRIHSGYLVNVKHIFCIKKDIVELDNKKILPLSRYRITEVKQAFQKSARSKL